MSGARASARELRRRADAVTARLLYGAEPAIDLEIAMDVLREWVRATMPDRLALFDMVYAARWQRLREQGWEHPRRAV